MNSQDLIFILSVTLQSSIAVLFAAVGRFLRERSGILNLGLKGWMLMGALSGFRAAFYSHHPLLGFWPRWWWRSGCWLRFTASSPSPCARTKWSGGLTLAIFGIGLSLFLGRPIIGRVGERFIPYSIPLLKDIPTFGPVLFQQSPIIYLSYLLVPLAWLFLFHSRPGLNLRAVGEKSGSRRHGGIGVVRIRYVWTIFGGMMQVGRGPIFHFPYTRRVERKHDIGQGWIAIGHGYFCPVESSEGRPLVPFSSAGSMLFNSISKLASSLSSLPISSGCSPTSSRWASLVIVTRKKRSVNWRVLPGGSGHPRSEREEA